MLRVALTALELIGNVGELVLEYVTLSRDERTDARRTTALWSEKAGERSQFLCSSCSHHVVLRHAAHGMMADVFAAFVDAKPPLSL